MKKTTQEKPGLEKSDILKMCICGGCPTYMDCGTQGKATETTFCMSDAGKSGCITEENGCLCGACHVKIQMKLKNIYFCTKWSEDVQNA